MILYRPVGLAELKLIFFSHFRHFPPRLPTQPIFYPVLSEEYAAQIARDWNTLDPNSGFAGFVTQFEVSDAFVAKYEIHFVGKSAHSELWVPSDELDDFNEHILKPITITQAFFGNSYIGFIPDKLNFVGKTAREQWLLLGALEKESNIMEFMEVQANWEAVYFNYGFWKKIAKPTEMHLLHKVRDLWNELQKPFPLPVEAADVT